MNFIPQSVKNEEAPYFEDVTSSSGVRGHATSKTVKTLTAEISMAISNLGGIMTALTPGVFDGEKKRSGYRLEFSLYGIPGMILVAALPLKKRTPAKEDAANRHALFTLRDMLVSMYNSSILQPGHEPLLPYLMLASGRTIGETYTSVLPGHEHDGPLALIEGEIIA